MNNKDIMIVLSGKASSGKDTFANRIQHNYSDLKHFVKVMAFADSLKSQLYYILYPLCPDLDEKYFYDHNLKNEPLPIKLEGDDGFKTPRELMQWYGELIKKELDQDYWCRVIKEKIKDHREWRLTAEKPYEKYTLIISDMRFKKEIDFIKNSEFINKNYHIFFVTIESLNSENMGHISETNLDEYYEYDYKILNNGTIDEYYNKIDIVYSLILEKVNSKGRRYL